MHSALLSSMCGSQESGESICSSKTFMEVVSGIGFPLSKGGGNS